MMVFIIVIIISHFQSLDKNNKLRSMDKDLEKEEVVHSKFKLDYHLKD